MNTHIVGGWHYIAPKSGMMFRNFSEFRRQLPQFWARVQAGDFQPRQWWTAHFGPGIAGLKLAAFVNSLERRPVAVDPSKRPPYAAAAPPNHVVNADPEEEQEQ